MCCFKTFGAKSGGNITEAFRLWGYKQQKVYYSSVGNRQCKNRGLLLG